MSSKAQVSEKWSQNNDVSVTINPMDTTCPFVVAIALGIFFEIGAFEYDVFLGRSV
jgi:hypothetical protein